MFYLKPKIWVLFTIIFVQILTESGTVEIGQTYHSARMTVDWSKWFLYIFSNYELRQNRPVGISYVKDHVVRSEKDAHQEAKSHPRN